MYERVVIENFDDGSNDEKSRDHKVCGHFVPSPRGYVNAMGSGHLVPGTVNFGHRRPCDLIHCEQYRPVLTISTGIITVRSDRRRRRMTNFNFDGNGKQSI